MYRASKTITQEIIYFDEMLDQFLFFELSIQLPCASWGIGKMAS